MRPESFDFLSNLSTVWAIIIGAVLATVGGLFATWIERRIELSQRERTAALFFGETMSTLGVILVHAQRSRQIGDPYGAITQRMLRLARREIEIYERNRENLVFLRNGSLRARIHTEFLRTSLPLDGIFDLTQEIALAEAHLKALAADAPERADVIAKIASLRASRDAGFDLVMEMSQHIESIVADLEPLAHQSFRHLAEVARS
jgi:hypothetical protein